MCCRDFSIGIHPDMTSAQKGTMDKNLKFADKNYRFYGQKIKKYH